LEGNTQRGYIKGMAKACYENGFDVLAWNYRGCSEEINRQLRFYHSGATEDLDTVVKHAENKGLYREIYLVGFSLGGNLTLKYLGEERTRTPLLKKAVTFSVPLNLYTSCLKISTPSNWIYSQRFLKSLSKKVVEKSREWKVLDVKKLSTIRTLMEFDDQYTGPIHGYTNALDYYEKCSSIRFINEIGIPTLIINAKNDPFLSPECYPEDQFKEHSFLSFETPNKGGHVGFTQFDKNGLYWSEQRVIAFLNND
ncbi:MAG: alpha/beta fold hydrolase, partial [Cyclobacteriaceae bacterium]|nr:alpha/beta fold hydrolase [Cyclobacteriaceae bacterium]